MGSTHRATAQYRRRDRLGRFANEARTPPDGDLVTASPRKNLDQFRYALQQLDAELRDRGILEQVRIRAIGGFALLVHDLRDDGVTVDIDTITDTYDPAVRAAIRAVAGRLHLEPDWISNEAAGDRPEAVLEMLDAVFIAEDYGLERIDLRIADVPTLTRAKAMAVDTDAVTERARDWIDLAALLRHQGIVDYDGFRRRYPDIRDWEYPETHRSLRSWFETGERGTPEVDPDEVDFDDLSWVDGIDD